jgi:hypothetical protein
VIDQPCCFLNAKWTKFSKYLISWRIGFVPLTILINNWYSAHVNSRNSVFLASANTTDE